MKKNEFFKRVTGALALAVTLVLTGCSEAVIGGKVDDGNGEDVVIISCGASIVDAKGNVLEDLNSEERTLLPTWYKSEDLTFKLFGTSLMGKPGLEEGKDITLKDTKVALPKDVWTLVLNAYTSDNKLAYTDKKLVDTTNGLADTTIKFNLSVKDVKTKGGCAVTLDYSSSGYDDIAVDSIKLGLYDKKTRAEVDTVEIKGEDIDGEYVFERDGTIDPGTYLFVARFYKNKTQVGPDAGELIAIDPANTTTAKITVKALDKKPDAPQNLRAYYVDGSANDSKYKVHVSWKDNSNNEDYFVLTLKEYSSLDDDATVTTVATLDTSKENNFLESKYYVDGSLLCSNEWIDLQLKTGIFYEIELYAHNICGNSTSAVRKTTPDDATAAPAATYFADVTDGTVKYKAFGTSEAIGKITLTQIAYVELSDYTVKIDEKTVNGCATYYHYETYKGNDIVIPDGKTSTGFTVTKQADQYVTSWVDKDGNPVTKLTSVADIEVYPYFEEFYLIDADYDDYTVHELKAESVEVKDKDENVLSRASGNLTLDASKGVNKLFVSVNVATYDKYEFFIDGHKKSVPDASKPAKFNIDTSTLKTGWHSLMIYVYKETVDQYYSFQLPFFVAR